MNREPSIRSAMRVLSERLDWRVEASACPPPLPPRTTRPRRIITSANFHYIPELRILHDLNSFRIRSYKILKKSRIFIIPLDFNPIRIRSSGCKDLKSFRIRSSGNKDLKSFRINSSKKHGGRGVFLHPDLNSNAALGPQFAAAVRFEVDSPFGISPLASSVRETLACRAVASSRRRRATNYRR